MYASYYFDQGITSGSQWYSITGGMMDWNYRYMGCPEVTMEISSVKAERSALPLLWEDNRNSMFAYARGILAFAGWCDRTTAAPSGRRCWW